MLKIHLSYGYKLKCSASLELVDVLKDAHFFARSNSVAHATDCAVPPPTPKSENRRYKAWRLKNLKILVSTFAIWTRKSSTIRLSYQQSICTLVDSSFMQWYVSLFLNLRFLTISTFRKICQVEEYMRPYTVLNTTMHCCGCPLAFQTSNALCSLPSMD